MKNFERCLERTREYMSNSLFWKLNGIKYIGDDIFEINIDESPYTQPKAFESYSIFYNAKKDIFFNDEWDNLEEI